MTKPDYRAMCAELASELEDWIDGYLINDPSDIHTDAAYKMIERARALLDQPQPEGPTDEELMDTAEFYIEDNGLLGLHNAGEFARAVLTHWGRPTPQPEPEDRSQISDGYHTFAELYEHRHALMLAFMRAAPDLCWFSQRHSDGELCFGGGQWFIVGAELSTGMITYHLPIECLPLAQQTGATELAAGRPWDGHTASDVIEHLRDWVGRPTPQPPADGEVAEVPTDEDLEQLVFDNHRIAISFACDSKEEAQVMISGYVKFARAVLAKWGHQ